jgi:uncharacterized protein YbjT (DUF2867 family)
VNIAITGATGFVGRHIVRLLHAQGHGLVLIARGRDTTDVSLRALPRARFSASGLDDAAELTQIISGCHAVVHCAGINRETGDDTFETVHVAGTRHLVEAARAAGLKKIILISFLRARPRCGSPYHESKWAAEEIVRASGLDYTILKCAVIYGRGDHMLNHLSHAFYTFPVFAFVGFVDKAIRPVAVEDVARIVSASVAHQELSRKTVAVVGPEQLTLREAVVRVANQTGHSPLMFPMPVWFHYLLGWCLERLMKVPMVARAQVRMLAEGLAEPAPICEPMPDNLAPRIAFSADQIRKGLPPPGSFTWRDLRCCSRRQTKPLPRHRVFFEMP